MMRSLAVVILLLYFTGCASSTYMVADSHTFKKVRLPLTAQTQFKVSQGAFGKDSHSERGNEYSWDLEVPFGSDVIAVEDGKVIEVWAPDRGGGCDKKFSDDAHNIKILAKDGTVAQYVHVRSLVKKGQKVKRGAVIAKTAKNGFICHPHLHFGIYLSVDDLYNSPTRKTLPLFFEGIEDGRLVQGQTYVVP